MWSSRSDSSCGDARDRDARSTSRRPGRSPPRRRSAGRRRSSSATRCGASRRLSRAVASASRRRGRLLVLLVVDRRVLLLGDAVELLLRLAQRGRRGRMAQADARRGLVDEVDRLVRQVPVGDVADRQVGRGLDRLVGDGDLVVLLVPLADPHQDVDGLLERRLLDHDRLEAPLQGRVALDVLAVLVERRRADALELAARQRRLEDVRRVDRALGRAGADERVELVDEEHRVVRVAQLLDDLLEPLLELAAVLRAGDERADVEGQDALVQQDVRHVAGHDPMREALGDGRLADARLADQRRVVLRLAAEDLDDPLDLLLAADDRIELAGAGRLREVDAERVDGRGLAGALRLLRWDRRTSSATGRGSPRGGPCPGSRRDSRGRRRRSPRLRGRGRAAGAPCRCSCGRGGAPRRSPVRSRASRAGSARPRRRPAGHRGR